MLFVTLPDGSKREFESAVSVADVAKSISTSLGKAAIAARLDDKLVDTSTVIDHDATLAIITEKDPEALEIVRHSTAHLMAQAVKELYPDAQVTIGPAIENGFYYDFSYKRPFTPEDLTAIEKRMDELAAKNIPIVRKEMKREDAIKFFLGLGEKYKAELIEAIPEGETISLYEQGDFVDLCRGPHVPSTGKLKVHKLMKVAGAYWRGDSKNEMLQRIYGTAWLKKDDLKAYLTMLEEAEKRDHRKLGKQLNLFSFHEEGPGFPFFHPKGMVIRNELIAYERELFREFGYEEIMTPIILSKKLWLQSGHWDHYKENMYFTQIDEEDYAVKPMNCPGGILYYKTNQHSYRELPKRVGEFGIVHRHELHGALHGLFRVRVFTQDDAHIFMTQDQMKDEVIKTMEMYRKLYSVFGLEYHVELSTRPENSMGSEELWEISTNALRDAVEAAGVPYVINEGDGAFYGPKLDFHIKDCLGRTWQCGTIQMDMQLPERFDVNYVGEDGEKHRAVMLHRAGYGSLERFIGILIEHFAGAFPSWIAPVQVKVVPVTEKHMNYARSVADALSASNVRVEIEEGNDTLGYKIRKAQMEKVPYTLVVGDKEMNGHTVSVRSRKNGDEGSLPVAVFVSNLIREIRDRSY